MAGQLSELANGLTLRQKAMLIGGAVFVATVLFLFVRYAGSPESKVLYSGMKPEEAQALSASLAAKGIVAQVSADGGTVSVPADKLDAGRLEVASAGAPHSGRMGFELFDKVDWASSDFDHKVNYQRAIEGELERTIQTLSGVEAVRVHVVMPAESIFTEREQKAKASVTLRMRSPMSDTSETAIARLVASAVDRLDPEDVTIVDAQTSRRVGGGQTGAAAAEDQLTRRLISTLEPVAGSERIRASIEIETDPSASEESEEKYDPNSVVALNMQRTEERSGSGIASGVPGTASNLPGATPGAAARNSDDSQASKSENGTYAVNRTVRRTVHPAGRVRRVSAAVVVDDALELKTENGQQKESRRKRTADEMKQIEELAKAAIGFDASRGDVISVQNVSFALPSAIEPPALPTKLQRVQRVANDWSSVLRYALLAGVFGVVYLLLIRPVKNQFLSVLKQVPKRPAAVPVDGSSALETTNVLGAVPESADAKRSQLLKKQVLDKVAAQPAVAARLVQGWIGEGGSR
jgi:flagellar M-ring protein FliF